MTQQSRKTHTALILPGGGARGAYQVGVLKAICEIQGCSKNLFPVICGTSAGAINAAVIASHAHDMQAGVRNLEMFWRSMKCERIYRTDAWTVLKSGLRFAVTLLSAGMIAGHPKSLLDNEPLREFLSSELKLEGIDTAIAQNALQAVSVTASGYISAGATSYYQAAEGIQPWERPRRKGIPTKLQLSHLMASTALPFIFPAERIGNEYFGDGGMRLTAPLSPAIHLGADRILVIGTRDERQDLPPGTPPEYPSAGEIGGYLLDTIFMDTLNADLARLNRINQTLKLVSKEQRKKTNLIEIDSLVIKPSRDLRDITRAHVHEIPKSVQILLRTIGGWGRDWRMASYLLFASSYCSELIDLGYTNGMESEVDLRRFLDI